MPNKMIEVYEPSLDKKVYFFQIKANFILKRRLYHDDDDEMMGSEIHCMCMYDIYGEDYLKNWMIRSMLKAYRMPEDGIESLVSRVFDFAKKCSVDDDDKLIMPVVVDLDVCTVPLERETIAEAYDRSIRAQCLIPMYLCVNSDLEIFLRNLERTRVGGVAKGFSLMEVCAVCLCNPNVGAWISKLPCGHAFHSHCVVEWLIKSNSCPLCRSQVHDFPSC